MRHTHERAVVIIGVAALLTCGVASPSIAQLNSQHIKGSAGLKAGSQPPPGVYFVAPYLFFYTADEVRDRDGRVLRATGTLDTAIFGGGINVVTSRKLLGATYGFLALVPGANNRIQGTEIDLNPGAGITDTAIQPVSLGWHFKQADAIAGYTVFVPTGRYEHGASNNTGLGMWGHEIAVGATVYFDEARRYHAATLATFDFSSEKEDSETKVGNVLNLEGGAGADFLKGGLTIGAAYYATIKLTEDRIEGLPGILVRGKNRVFALGPDVTLALARRDTVYGFVTVRYQWEVYARTTTTGGAWNIQAVFPMRPIKVSP